MPGAVFYFYFIFYILSHRFLPITVQTGRICYNKSLFKNGEAAKFEAKLSFHTKQMEFAMNQ